MRFPTTAILFVLLAETLAAGTPLLKDQSLRWSPTTKIAELNLGGLNLTALEGEAIEVMPFTDNRPNPGLIGENREDEDQGKVLPVLTKDKVSDFVTVQAKSFFKGIGLPIVESHTGIQLNGELISFLVTETSTYKGDVRIKVRIKVDGETIWTGMAIGAAKRFGRSYRMENYNEVLCDALLDALSGLLRSPEFLKALGSAK